MQAHPLAEMMEMRAQEESLLGDVATQLVEKVNALERTSKPRRKRKIFKRFQVSMDFKPVFDVEIYSI